VGRPVTGMLRLNGVALVRFDAGGVETAVGVAIVGEDGDEDGGGLAGVSAIVGGDGGEVGVAIGEDADIVDGDGTFFAAEAEQVEVKGGKGASGDAGEVYLDGAGAGEVGEATGCGYAGEGDAVTEVGVAGMLQVEEGVGLGQPGGRADEGLQGLGVEQGGFESVTGGEVTGVEVDAFEGKLQATGSFGDDEGLFEVTHSGRG
jgi:hypothetical protein